MTAAAPSPVVEARAIAKSYPSSAGRLEILHGLDLVVAPGETVAVTGPSGSGKSTLLHLVGLLDRPDSGRLVVDGRDASALSPREAAALRNRRIGFVFQFHGLLPEWTAVENAAMPLLVRGEARRASIEAARRLLEAMGLGRRLDHRPAALSGGECQRVAIARALVAAPALVLADEPTGDLDEATGLEVADVLFERLRASGAGGVLVTHNPALAGRADRRYRLHQGRLVEA